MLNRLNELSFVIGVFFTIVSIILFINMLVTGSNNKLSLYSSIVFLLFGLCMMFLRKGGKRIDKIDDRK